MSREPGYSDGEHCMSIETRTIRAKHTTIRIKEGVGDSQCDHRQSTKLAPRI
jgi:hypothetical protein